MQENGTKMRRYILRGLVGLGLTAAAVSQFVSCDVIAQEVEIAESAVTLSSGSGRAELWLQLADGSEHRVAFTDGRVEVDGTDVAPYDSDLVATWRALLREHAGADGRSVRRGLLEFRDHLSERGQEGSRREARATQALGAQLDRILGTPLTETDEVATVAGPNGISLQIAPGGLEFDFSGELDRLRDALARLSTVGQEIDVNRLAMIVHDDFQIGAGREIEGHLALLDGTLRLAGEVDGDVFVLDGTLRLEDGARIDGDVLQVGGDIDFGEGGAVVRGEILSDFPIEMVRPVAPVTPERPSGRADVRQSGDRSQRDGDGFFHQLGRNVAHAAEGLMGAFTTFIGLAVLGLLLVYFAQGRLETVSDTVRHEFARSFAMGLAGQVLFVPALLVLVVLVITWPIVPFFVLGCGIAAVLGYVAVAHGAGEMFAQRPHRYAWLERLRRSNSYYYVISGLVLLLLPFAAGAVLWVVGGTLDVVRGLIAFVACAGTWVLGTAGFGSVLLTRAGGRSVVVDWAAEPAVDMSASEIHVDEDDDV